MVSDDFIDSVNVIANSMATLLIRKQADYGPGNINNAYGSPINGLLVRMGDKFERLKNLYATGDTPNFEAIEDTFMDLANYAIIGIMIERNEWPK